MNKKAEIIGGIAVLGALFALSSVREDAQPVEEITVSRDTNPGRDKCWEAFDRKASAIERETERTTQQASGSPEAMSRALAQSNASFIAATNERIACGLEQR